MLSSKIEDRELLEFLEGKSRRRVSVVLYALREKRVSVRPSAGAVPKVSLSGLAQDGAAMDRLEADLHRLGLAQRARRNTLAQVFVLELTRRQLCEAAALPSVMRIRPNRWVLPSQGERFRARRLGLLKSVGSPV